MDKQQAIETFKHWLKGKFDGEPDIERVYRTEGGWMVVCTNPKGNFSVSDKGQIDDPGGVFRGK